MLFPTTNWSLLARASLSGETEAHAALDELCRRYWAPLHQFIQMRGYQPAEAEDLTQAFLLHLMQHEAFRKPDKLKGRFRSFLLGALVRFLHDERDRRAAQKRGGHTPHVSLESQVSEHSPLPTAAEALRFDRAWAVAILRASLARVQAEYVAAGQGPTFEVARQFLPGTTEPPSYEHAAGLLGMSVSAFTSELHRLRKRVRDLTREEIIGTVSLPHEVDEELAHLQTVLMDRGTDLQESAER